MNQFPNLPLKNRLPSKGEFKVYSGYDLDEIMGEQADSFMYRVAVRFESFLNARLFVDIDHKYPSFSDHQKACYKYAIMEQMIWVIINGDSTTVATSNEKNLSPDEIIHKAIAPEAIQQLMNAGVWSKKFPTYSRDNLNYFLKGN